MMKKGDVVYIFLLFFQSPNFLTVLVSSYRTRTKILFFLMGHFSIAFCWANLDVISQRAPDLKKLFYSFRDCDPASDFRKAKSGECGEE